MNKHVVTLFIILIPLVISAQDEAAISRWAFKLSPQHFVQNTLKFGLEHFNEDYKRSMTILLGARTNSSDGSSWNAYKGLSGELQFRKYVSPFSKETGRHPHYKGIYGGAFAQGGYYMGDRYATDYAYDMGTGQSIRTRYDFSDKVWNTGLGFILGIQRVYFNAVFFDIYVGGGIQMSGLKRSGQIPPEYLIDQALIAEPSFKGIIPKIGITLGLGL